MKQEKDETSSAVRHIITFKIKSTARVESDFLALFSGLSLCSDTRGQMEKLEAFSESKRFRMMDEARSCGRLLSSAGLNDRAVTQSLC